MSLELPPSLASTLPSRTNLPAASGAPSSFQTRLSRGLSVASQVVGAAGPVVPGAGLVSLALGGLSRLFGPGRSTGQSPVGASGGGNELDSLVTGSRSLNLKYLALQESMAREARAYTALSNIMRARHESAQNAISNIR